MTVDEIKNFFGVKYDKDLIPKLGVSASTISKWRKEGINFVRQESIQLKTSNRLIARTEDEGLLDKEVSGI